MEVTIFIGVVIGIILVLESLHRKSSMSMVCPNPNCGYTGKMETHSRGSFLVGLFLCLFFLLPGLIYFALMSGYRYICPQCGILVREK